MRKNLLAGILCLFTSVMIQTNSNAQSKLVYFWDFNTFSSSVTIPAVASLAADYAAAPLDTAKARWIDAPQYAAVLTSSWIHYCDDVAGDASDTVNERTIGGTLVPSGNSFRARNPNDSMQLLIFMPTTGYKNLQIKYGCQLSSYTSGDSINVFSYSRDSGSTWISSGTGLSEWVDSGSTSFKMISFHVNDTLAYNNPKFVLRIMLIGRNQGFTPPPAAPSWSGNNRFDNFSLDGDPITSLGVANTTPATALYSIYPNPVSNQVTVNSNIDGEKSVIITNILGQSVISEKVTGKSFPISAAALNSGVYFMTIRETETGAVTTVKFVKG